MYNQRNMEILQERIEEGQYQYLAPILNRFKKAESAKTRRALNTLELELNEAFRKLKDAENDEWIIELLGSYFLNLELMLGKKEKKTNTRWSLFVESLKKRNHKVLLEFIESIDNFMESGNTNKKRLTKEELNNILTIYRDTILPYIEEMDPVEGYRANVRLKQRVSLLEKKVTSGEGISFGEWLNIKRTAKGWSYHELATKTGYSAAYMYRIEKGSRKNPSTQVIAKIVTALGYKPDDYLNLIMTDQEDDNELKDVDIVDLLLLSNYTINGNTITPDKRKALAQIVELVGQTDVLQLPKVNDLQEAIKEYQDME